VPAAPVRREDADAAAHGGDAAKPCRCDAAFQVGIEERRNLAQLAAGLHRASWWPARIASGLDFTDEQAFPIASFLHRLDRALLA
jgi:hypothetical protein